MPAQSGILSNPMLALLPPDQQQNLLQLQQRQAIGQGLLQQGMTPLDTSNRQVGGMVYHVSPLEGVSKMLNAYLGNKISMDSMGQQAHLMGGMYANAFGSSPQAAAAPQGAPATGTTPNPFDAGGMTDGQSGAGVQSAAVPTPGAQPSPQQVGAAMGGAPGAAPQQSQGGALTLPGKTPQQSMQIFSIVGPEAYGKMLSEWSGPTAATKAAQQGGFDPAAANRAMFGKDSYIAPVVAAPNSTVISQTGGGQATLPAAAPAGFQNVQGKDNQWYTVPVAGGTQANQAASAADAAGKAQYQLTQVYNPTTGQMEFKPQADVANATSGAGPAPIRNNNPGAMMPGGKLATYPDMQTGLQALDDNLKSYGKQGVNTISGVIGKWAPPNENNTQAYIQDVSQRLGIGPNQKLDLTNPLQRQALSTAISLHENGPAGVFGSGTSTGGGIAAAPPIGLPANADAAQAAGAQTMKDSYQKLQAGRSTAQAALDALQTMQTLGSQKSAGAIGPIGTGLASAGLSTNAVEYEKQRANVISMLAGQSAGKDGVSDAARANVGNAVPDYGKPKEAIANGVQTLINQTRAQQLKADVLTPAYNAGDSKTYTTLENQFDQTIRPSMMPQVSTLLAMPPGPARATALSAAAKDPGMHAALDLLVRSGNLK